MTPFTGSATTGDTEYGYDNSTKAMPTSTVRFYSYKESTFSKLLLAAFCFCGSVIFALVWYDRHAPPIPEPPKGGLLEPTKDTFLYRETIALNFVNRDPDPTDWIGLFLPHDYTNRSVMWQYACGGIKPCHGREEELFTGELHFGGEHKKDLFSDYNLTWPLCSGEYKACLMTITTMEGDIARNETLACSDVFNVAGDGPCVGFVGGGRR
mmetsp:Transcript_30435/g.50222  ORF Transcript_30435/g.50222 Transcript_30435/m.50222 type:complete len:210 (-) Transcript_30435:619-1248(-)|eukprot:CAMPEP_0119007746 /NCGR_PEP_ID=MMETSP1176-20130426/3217_1 /TAXON_ID=265551 /ORGANISM="Synedropsis recta cf, Strain CCMP1620" /LENGTH=209 /DNA_ID=CAMNT_0006959947 /DNA_START=64 /DNA_END=693 /DNA_ORIENTATION=-